MQYDYQSPTSTRAAELLPTQNQMPFLERLLGQWEVQIQHDPTLLQDTAGAKAKPHGHK
jgi:hypothetical protein